MAGAVQHATPDRADATARTSAICRTCQRRARLCGFGSSWQDGSANPVCFRQTFGDHLPAVAQPYAHRTHRVVDLTRLVTHIAGGRSAGRLVARRFAWSASMTGVGGRAQPTGRSWSIWSAARLSTSCRIPQLIRPPAGWESIRRSKSSAVTAAVFMRRVPLEVRRKLGRWPTAST